MAKYKDKFREVLVEDLDSHHVWCNSYHIQNIMKELETTQNQIISLIQGGAQMVMQQEKMWVDHIIIAIMGHAINYGGIYMVAHSTYYMKAGISYP